MAHLCLLDEDGAVARRWEIGDRPMAVGRDEGADVMVPDKSLSRRHFCVWREGREFLIKDLDSQNGTWVDGERAHATKLVHNVCIVAGRTVFLFSEKAAAAATAKPTAARRRHVQGTPAP